MGACFKLRVLPLGLLAMVSDITTERGYPSRRATRTTSYDLSEKNPQDTESDSLNYLTSARLHSHTVSHLQQKIDRPIPHGVPRNHPPHIRRDLYFLFLFLPPTHSHLTVLSPKLTSSSRNAPGFLPVYRRIMPQEENRIFLFRAHHHSKEAAHHAVFPGAAETRISLAQPADPTARCLSPPIFQLLDYPKGVPYLPTHLTQPRYRLIRPRCIHVWASPSPLPIML